MPAQLKDPEQSRPSNRKYVLLASLLLVLFAGWSAFWYVSYTKTQQLIDRLMARKINDVPVLTCQNQTLGGYPFRLVLECSSYNVINAGTGWQIQGGPLRAIWQVYAPNLAVVETESRLRIDHQPSEQSFEMVTTLIRGSVRFSPGGYVTRASFEADNSTLTSSDQRIAKIAGTISARKLSIHVRQAPEQEDDLDLSFAATELSAAPMPVMSGQISLTARDGLAEGIKGNRNPAEAWLQQSGVIEKIDGLIEVGQKTLKFRGGLSFDRQRLANGEIKLRILNPDMENAKTAETLTARRDGLNGPLTALQLMGKPVKDGELIGSEVDIRLDAGKISAGILPLGKIPPLR